MNDIDMAISAPVAVILQGKELIIEKKGIHTVVGIVAIFGKRKKNIIIKSG